MEDISVANASQLETNVTLEQIASVLNLTVIVSNATNVTGAVTPEKLFSLYEAYRTREREQLMLYKSVAYVMGTLIILSNLTVVISSGLILRKGQQPKSTYLLLGNVSLADTIIGISLIFGTIVDNTVNSNVLCIFQIGMIVCPTMVSIFSVGLIAIDRYIYIIHGLYYQRWINTTRVRIGILIIWILGLSIGLIPATGWINQELKGTGCFYISLFPNEMIFFNAILSLIPITLVAVLYTHILIRALKNIKNIKSKVTNVTRSGTEKPKLRVYRGNLTNMHNSVKFLDKDNSIALKRCASMSTLHRIKKAENKKKEHLSEKSKSIEKLNNDAMKMFNSSESSKNKLFESKLSIWTINSEYNRGSSLSVSTSSSPNSSNIKNISHRFTKRLKSNVKPKEPCKLRAMIVVFLTSGSFIVTWVPFFICAMFYIFCQNKLENPECFHLQGLLTGPLATLAFINSILNPLIYAWWHRGFKSAVKSYILKHYCRETS